MRITRWVGSVALVLFAAFSAGCHGSGVTLYEHAGFNGGTSSRSGADGTFVGNDYSNGHDLNDSISSVRNRSAKYAVIYEHSNYDGVVLCMAPDTEENDLHRSAYRFGPGRLFGDRPSSIDFETTAPPGDVCTFKVGF